MLNWYDWVFMGVGIVIIILCLLQGGKSEGASGAITGGGLNVFVKTKERGAEKVVSILTLVMAIIFFVIAIVIQVSNTNGASASTETAESIRMLL
jgi:preprotein translocase subunit SecG